MACDCIETINAKISEVNGRLGMVFSMTGEVYPSILVEKIKPRGQRPPIAVPTFCPFCGVRYMDADHRPEFARQ